ncbi:hypothetical protein NE236_24385 [Actinoallomurus purpureus]|uniref:hypothetical protein n=1 Tax=Actinoallomurus purpureus TaxID=478114 RepID=UPI0020928ED0|nr:hypothetical protein [Actinoallomurus purpureus]MCO6008123.1 hypothetical protein [Actinoallomurus purpureus]
MARPIYQTATFWAEDAEQFAQAAVDRRGRRGGRHNGELLTARRHGAPATT